MKIYRIHSKKEYMDHCERSKGELARHFEYIARFKPNNLEEFTVPGFSYTANQVVDFIVDYQHSGGSGNVNWRERVCCPVSYFNNRMRATFHLCDIEMEVYDDSKIYITEQVTPIYKYLSDKYKNSIGSEYLGPSIKLGHINSDNIRNEDLSQLTFEDNSFDGLISLDVLEHIPDYMKAISECYRVLKPGQKMLWTAPFNPNEQSNLVRAILSQDGVIKHLQPPEYHGDPLSDEGVLCYQHFGWDVLDQFRDAGFREAYALVYQSTKFGYLGGEQQVFVARK